MKYTIQERLNIGAEYFNSNVTSKELQKKYGITRSTLNNYARMYRDSINATERKSEYVRIPKDTRYSEYSKDQLVTELIKKDIEIERLKKGYQVKGVGASKEFVTISDANTK